MHAHKTHAEELKDACDEIHRLRQTLAEYAYLHPMNLASNVKNIQALLPVYASVTIGAEAIAFTHNRLGHTFACNPDELPELLKHTEWIKERLSDE